MMRTTGICLLTLGSLTAWISSGQAQIVTIQTPRVSIQVGRPPLAAVAVPGRVAVPVVQEPVPVAPQPRVVPIVPMQPADPLLPAPTPVPLRPMTHREFACLFKPVPGCHEALLIHPGSGCPVLVRFSLPPGCPRVRVGCREVEFDYGCKEVEIRFKLFGRVAVNYD